MPTKSGRVTKAQHLRRSPRVSPPKHFRKSSGSSVSSARLSTSTAPTEHSPSPRQTKPQNREKQRDAAESDSEYEQYFILKGHPCLRDPTEIPVIATNASGERKTVWTKLDTGADFNSMTDSVVKKLGRENEMVPVSATDEVSFRDIGGKTLELDRKITLTIWAGHRNMEMKEVEFLVPRFHHNSDEDGVPDVILGWSMLTKNHMVMIDPEFCKEEEPELEVLAKRSDDEVCGVDSKVICLGKKYPQIRKPSGR